MTIHRWFRSGLWLLGLGVLISGLTWFGMSSRKSAADTVLDNPSASEPVLACFGHVDVKHGVTSLYPTQPGRVAEVMVEEDEIVPAGAVLLRLEDTAVRLRVEEARADLEAARLQLVEARKLPQQHQAKVAQLRASIASVTERLAAARNAGDWKEDLYAKQLLNHAERDIAWAQVKEVEAMLQAEQQRLAELQLHDPVADVRRAAAAVKGREAQLGQAQEALRQCELRAPQAGKVLRILVGPGETLGAMPKQPAILFCPDLPRFIRAEVAQESAYQVKIGDTVIIHDDSSDFRVWQGRVNALSDWFTQRRSILQEPLQYNDVRTLECLITLNPDQPPLRIGQRVRVLIGGKMP